MNPLPFFLSVAASALLVAQVAAANVVVAPDRIVFNDAFDSKTLNVTVDGKPADLGAFENMPVMSEDGFEYKNIFRIEEKNGGLRITPTQSLQNGVYFLNLKRGEQTTRVPLFVSITRPQSTQEADTTAETPAVEDPVQQQTSPENPYPDATVIELPIPEVMYQGETLTVPITTPAGRQWSWMVNGDVVRDGFGEHTFEFVFQTPGTYTVTYVEQEDDTIIGYGSRNVLVIGEGPRVINVQAGEPITLTGPEGFGQYEWTVDGVVQSQQIGLQWTFTAPGLHEIRMTARTLRPDQGDVYQQRTYQVAVQ